jgi:endonuclease G
LLLGCAAVSAWPVAVAAAPSPRPLRWKAPRGNAGQPPPSDPVGWSKFNGSWPAAHRARYLDPGHHEPVPLPGLRPAAAHPPRSLEEEVVHADLVRRGVDPILVRRAARNVLFGLPSGAGKDAADDYLIARKDLVLSYSASRRSPNWASWVTTTAHAGLAGRSDHTWRADPSLPADFPFASLHDFEAAGYDPGHLLPAAERQSSTRSNARTYLTSNNLPQSIHSNRGPWLRFENTYRHHLMQHELEAHVIAGGMYGEAPLTIGPGIPVPNAMWKIVAFLEPGQRLADIDERTRVMAVVVPNSDAEVELADGFARYLTSPREIERRTGLRFFTNLPEPVAEALRKKIDAGMPVWPREQPRPE